MCRTPMNHDNSQGSREGIAAWLGKLPDWTVIEADLAPYPDTVRLINDEGDWRVVNGLDVWTPHAIAAERYGPLVVVSYPGKSLLAQVNTEAAGRAAIAKYHPGWPYDPKFTEQATTIIQAALDHATRYRDVWGWLTNDDDD